MQEKNELNTQSKKMHGMLKAGYQMIQMTDWCGSTTARGQSLWMEPLVSEPRVKGVGAADKAAIQLVKVQPYQLLVSDT
jgi:hypothetical protein